MHGREESGNGRVDDGAGIVDRRSVEGLVFGCADGSRSSFWVKERGVCDGDA